ncbi:MAG: 2-oxo acid dehydrogenase subunit E2, partial [Acidimicrobiales bacterium]
MSVRFSLLLPDLGEGITEAIVGTWMVEPGALVSEDEPILSVETDKAAVEIPSPVAGRLLEAVAQSGETVPVGSVLAVFEVGGAAEAADEIVKSDESQPAATAREVAATPGARRRAAERGVDLAAVAAGGGVGREDQVVAFAEKAGSAKPRPSSPELLPSSLPAERHLIASRLTKAAAVPTVTNVDQVDFEAVLGAGTPPLAAVAFVVARTLLDHPRLNLAEGATADPSGGVVHLGIATQSATGLVVPVVRGADLASLAELSSAISDVAERVRTGHVRPEELSGSTFTITSAG